MPSVKSEKPASDGAEPAPEFDQLGGKVNFKATTKPTKNQPAPIAAASVAAPDRVESRRLNPATARYSPALPDTAIAAALLKALRRRAGAR